MGAPRLNDLRQPEKLSTILKEDNPDDCLSCRLIGASPCSLTEKIGFTDTATPIGAAALSGLGAYSWISGSAALERNKKELLKNKTRIGMGPRKFGLGGIALGLVGLGIYRLVN